AEKLLDQLQTEFRKDPNSKGCIDLLRQLRLDHKMSPEQVERAMDVLAEVFLASSVTDAAPAFWPFGAAAAHFQKLALSIIPGGATAKTVEPLIGKYFEWLASQSDWRVIHALWEMYEKSEYGSSTFRYWHRDLVKSGRISSSYGPNELELAISLEKEAAAIFNRPKERWSAWEWSRDIEQYKVLLSQASPSVRAGAALVIGKLYRSVREANGPASVPPLAEILAWVSEEERRGTGVAGAFLCGAYFGIDNLWTDDQSIDLNEWMFEALAIGPEPVFTGFQSLAFYAHEFFEPSEWNLRRLVAMGREDAAIMLATESVNHDPFWEEQFRNTFAEWRQESAAAPSEDR
ncbi:MAG: hypothetical protein ABI823_06580, partial [Bryobacteraceae bacterium]